MAVRSQGVRCVLVGFSLGSIRVRITNMPTPSDCKGALSCHYTDILTWLQGNTQAVLRNADASAIFSLCGVTGGCGGDLKKRGTGGARTSHRGGRCPGWMVGTCPAAGGGRGRPPTWARASARQGRPRWLPAAGAGAAWKGVHCSEPLLRLCVCAGHNTQEERSWACRALGQRSGPAPACIHQDRSACARGS